MVLPCVARNKLGELAQFRPGLADGGASVARVVSSQRLTPGAAVYTYNTGVANSLTKTSVQVR